MSNNKVVFIFAIFCITFAWELTSAADAEVKGRATYPMLKRCSDTGKVVWATDDTLCHVFRNNCHFRNENYNRQINNIEVLRALPKEECQKMCLKMCTMEWRPICAEYNNVKKTFSNPCAYVNHICQTGETYSLYTEGECGSVK